MNPLATAEYLISIRQNDKAKIALDLMKPYATTIPQLDAIGKLYADIREFNDTLELARKIYHLVDLPAQKWDARVNIIRAHLNLNQPYEALEQVLINEHTNPDDHPNQMDKAMCMFLLNKKPEGEAVLRKILTQPHTEDIDFRVNFNLGTYDLANGNFKEGLRRVLLDGRKLNIWESFSLPPSRLWTGKKEPTGTIIYVCAEGGIGDEIISIRFMRHLQQCGLLPLWYTSRKDTADIFRRLGFDVTTTLSGFQPDFLWTYSMAVPAYLEVGEDHLWSGPYLSPLRITPSLPHARKIGIKCMGNPKYDQDLHRSIPFEQLVDSIPDYYQIYSFHIDEDFAHPRVIPLKDKIHSWEDTLDYIDQMDVIVSSCTSLAHAAGAIGKETIVIVPILNYYTWASPGHFTKWYGENLTVLRQAEYDNWNAPLLELKEIL